ncbi:MAG: HAMP domain-containing histidine kinase [Magnetococcales bacterium]|nr:HAMP domain-containing histidine kinase [Magnetococcales bacterium]
MDHAIQLLLDVFVDTKEVNQLAIPILSQHNAIDIASSFSGADIADHAGLRDLLVGRLSHLFDDFNALSASIRDKELFEKIMAQLYRYQEKLISIYDLQSSIGFTADEGLIGDVRRAIHSVESYLEAHSSWFQTEISLLQMRRYEKDFMQRNDMASLQNFHREYGKLRASIDLLSREEPGIDKIVAEIEQYQKSFVDLVAVRMAIRKDLEEFRRVYGVLNQLMLELMGEIKAQEADNKTRQNGNIINATSFFLLVMTGINGLIGFFIFLFFHSIIAPMLTLKEMAIRIAGGEYGIAMALSGSDEIGQMAEKLHEMKETMRLHHLSLEEKIAQRTLHLENAIAQLNAVQRELIHSEKMASLGRLVAGFAHEINTPIGIGITTMSTLPELVDQLAGMLEQESVDEDELETCLLNLRRNAELGLRNLQRTAELVMRFKRTSVDQSSEESRQCNLMDVLYDIQASVANFLKKTNCTIQIQCPRNLNLCFRPGLLAQVLTNLIVNSVKHGFEDGVLEGSITINAWFEEKTGQLQVEYRDNGRGIPASTLPKIFEPFFTTSRNGDGSGLGLYVVYGIVTEQLNGSIVCQSTQDQGVVFLIRFPVGTGS